MTHTQYGLIGCGMMGHEHIRNIQLLPNTRVSAIYEPDAGMRQQAAEFAPDAMFADSVADVVMRDDVDCLVIASPNHTHVELLKTITSLRTLPILVEKPLFTDPADGDYIKSLQSNYDAPIWVAMEYRYMPPLAEFIKRAHGTTGGIDMLTIKEHRFPFLVKVNDWNRFNHQSGGTLVEKCCHHFDLMRLLVNSNPVSVMASAGQAHNHLDEHYDQGVPDIWDHGYVIVNFENGARGMLELCMFAEGATYQEEVSALGPNGKIECLIPGPSRFWPEHLGEEPTPKVLLSPRSPKNPTSLDVPVDPELLTAGDHNGSTFYQHQRFLKVVRGEAQPEVTVDDGWWAVRMGQAAQESARTGEACRLT